MQGMNEEGSGMSELWGNCCGGLPGSQPRSHVAKQVEQRIDFLFSHTLMYVHATVQAKRC